MEDLKAGLIMYKHDKEDLKAGLIMYKHDKVDLKAGLKFISMIRRI